MKSVTKCVCKRVTFAEVKVIAAEKELQTLEALMEEKICGTGCGMCRLYIKKMLITGEVEFSPGDYFIRNTEMI